MVVILDEVVVTWWGGGKAGFHCTTKNERQS